MEMYSTIKNSQMHKAQPKTISLNPKASCFHSRVHYNTRISYMSLLENGCRKTKNIPIKFCHWPWLTQGKGWAMNFRLLLILSMWISVPLFSSDHRLKKRNYNLIRKRCTMHSTIYYPRNLLCSLCLVIAFAKLPSSGVVMDRWMLPTALSIPLHEHHS